MHTSVGYCQGERLQRRVQRPRPQKGKKRNDRENRRRGSARTDGGKLMKSEPDYTTRICTAGEMRMKGRGRTEGNRRRRNVK